MASLKGWVEDYVAKQNAALASISAEDVVKVVQYLQGAWTKDQQIFVAGNGGSAANASHFAVDLGKGASDKLSRRFRVLSLADNTPWITALGNDYSYDDVFVRQLENFARPGDLLILVSVSGNSPNLVKAAEFAKKHGVTVVSLVGAKRGRMAEISDFTIVVEDTHYGRAEDVQMHILHMMCYAFMENDSLREAGA